MSENPYLIEYPFGYQYCPMCELVTPHTLDGQVNPSKAIPEDWTCDICDHKKDDFGYCCPKCGWEHDPDKELAPETIKEKKHTGMCWEKAQFLDPTARRKHNERCDCPEVDCYTVQHNIFNYKSSAQQWNMECSNAIEWSYDVMCQVCNHVFEIEDGNC